MIYTQIVLDTRRKKPSGIYTVKLRVTFSRTQKYYLLGFNMTESDFTQIIKNPTPKKFQGQRLQLDHLELKAKKIIADLDAFSFSLFEEQFYKSSNSGKSLYELYNTTIKSKLENGKVSTALNYTCSKNSLMKHAPRLTFADVTPEFLRKYEKLLIEEGKSISTVGIYMRPLRAILNEAIERKLLPTSSYPFGKRKYTIPESRNIKKALSKEDFKKVVDFMPSDEGSYEARSRDFWLLSYLLQGANMKDLLLLRHENIEKEYIRFVREKTKDTVRRNITEITVPILPETMDIIKRWKDYSRSSGYVFSFVDENMTPIEVYKVVQQFVKVLNKHMSLIAQKVGIDKRITSYVARFQFTKTMMDADVSVEYIRQCLGHQNYATTKRYLGSFELDKKLEIARKHLLKFD